MDWHPLRFHPIYKDRIWGGRSLSRLYRRDLPGDGPIGESWEISDRPDAVSVVAEGPLAGLSLAQLLARDPLGLLGDAPSRAGRFPLLVKILDARQALSLQVHPPAEHAARLGGESKTEMWYITDANPGAELLAGLQPGTTRTEFEQRIADGSVARCFHRIPVQAGDAMFLPSGRVHALGAGLVLFEIQENSDTTYRVFDWNRTGLDGRPRELHVRESLESIAFDDFSPPLVTTPWESGPAGATFRRLVRDPLFQSTVHRTTAGSEIILPLPRCLVIGLIRGEIILDAGPGPSPVHLRPGDFSLVPAALRQLTVQTRSPAPAEWIVAEPGPAPLSPIP